MESQNERIQELHGIKLKEIHEILEMHAIHGIIKKTKLDFHFRDSKFLAYFHT